MQRHIQVTGALILMGAVGLGGCDGCGETEEDITLTTSTGEPAPSASATLEPDGAGGSGGEGGSGGGGGAPTPRGKLKPQPPGWLATCCEALEGNLKSAPIDQKPAYAAALTSCRGALKNPGLITTLKSQLPKGSPASCN